MSLEVLLAGGHIVTNSQRVLIKGFTTESLLWGILCIAGLVLGAFYILGTRNTAAIFNLGIDTKAYVELGREVAAKGVIAIPPTHPPGYLIFLSSFFHLSNSPFIFLKFANLFFIAVIAFLTYQIGKSQFSRRTGLIASVLICNSPGLLAYAATIQYEVFATFLFCCVLFSLYQGLNKEGKTQSFWLSSSAFILAYASLTREPLVLFFPALAGTVFLQNKKKGYRSFVGLLFFVVPLFLWVGYRSVQSGMLIPISSKSHINFLIGNNPKANGTFNLVRAGMEEPAGWSFIQTYPLSALSLMLRKAGYLWGFLKDGWNVPRIESLLIWKLTFGLFSYRDITILTEVICSCFAFGGIILSIRKEYLKHCWALSYMLIASTFFYCLFIGSYRFFVPLLPCVYLFAAFFLDKILVWLPHKRFKKKHILLLGSFLVLAFFYNTPFKWQISGAQMEGVSIRDASDDNGKASSSIIALPQDGPRLIGFVPPEYFPPGRFQITLQYTAEAETEKKLGHVTLRGPFSRSICRTPIFGTSFNGEYSELSMECSLPRPYPASLEVYMSNPAMMRLKGIEIRRIAAQ